MTSGAEPSVEDLLAEITARKSVAQILLRQDLLDQHRELDARLQAAAQADAAADALDYEPTAPALAEEVLALEAEIQGARRSFEFRSIGRQSWRKLLAQHPPTPDQRKISPGLDHNPDTFPAAAIAASCMSPKMTPEQVAQFEDALDLTEWTRLWAACLDANVGGDDNPKSLAAGRIARVNAELGITAAPAASPDQSSLDE